MEGYGAVSNRANRKLTRKRPFRNIEREAPKLKAKRRQKTPLTTTEKAVASAKWAKIDKAATTRLFFTQGLIYLLFFGLTILGVYLALF